MMPSDLIYIDESGASVAGFTDATEVFVSKVEEKLGGDVDKSVHTPQIQFATICASAWAEMGEEILRAITYGADLDYAPGKFLDAMGSLLNVRRRDATKTRVVCQLTGVAGTVIPKGSIVQDAQNNRFVSDAEVSLPAGGDSVSVYFTATQFGPIEVGASTITKIVSVKNGWETVRNNEPGVTGTDRESDTEYRANIKARTSQNASSSVSALESALVAAGATKYKVIENPSALPRTIGGIDVPAHSLCVAVSGGLADDISRAVNNGRGMGVNLFTATEGEDGYSSTAVAGMNSARFKFNDATYKDIDLSGDGTIEAIVNTLNAYPNKPANYPTFSSTGDRLLAFFSWGTDFTGFEDVDGQISPSIGVESGFHVKSALYQGTRVRLAFTERVKSIGTGSNAASVSYQATEGAAATTIATTASVIHGNMIEYTLASAIPDGAFSPTISLTNAGGSTRNVQSVYDGFAPASVALTKVELADDASPSLIETWVEPGNARVQYWASAFVPPTSGKNITGWSYRRFNGVEIIPADAGWVSISNSASNTITGTLSGYSNANQGARAELRAQNADSATTIAHTDDFSTSGTAPSLVSGEATIDGESIILPTNLPLTPSNITTGVNWWTITLSGGGSRSITEQRTRGSRIYLRVNSAVPEGNTITLAYTRPSTVANRVRSYTGASMANVTGFAVDNITIDKMAGRPSFVSAHRTFADAAGTTLNWTDNFNGGSAVDRYEYRTRQSSSARWGSWQVIPSATLRTLSFASNVDFVQMRASNPNIRFGSIFGFSNTAPVFVRSVPFNLTIGLDLKTSDTLTGNIIESIRNAIVQWVSQYDLGETIWANDIFARVERITGTEVKFNSSATYVKYKGVDVNAANAHQVPLYAEWVVQPSAVSIVFTP